MSYCSTQVDGVTMSGACAQAAITPPARASGKPSPVAMYAVEALVKNAELRSSDVAYRSIPPSRCTVTEGVSAANCASIPLEMLPVPPAITILVGLKL